LVFAALLTILPLTLLLGDFGEKTTTKVLVMGLPMLMIGFLNFRIALALFLFSLFVDINPALLISLAFLMIPYLIAAFSTTNGGFSPKEFSSPFTAPALLLIAFVLPSFMNSKAVTLAGLNMLMLPGFIMLFLFLGVALKQKEGVSYLAKVYVTIVSLNALYAIFQGVTSGTRAYGFAGIMFVDILGIGILIVFLLLLMNKGEKKVLYAALFGFLVIAMIFNKTRNVWINVLLVLFLSFIHTAIQSNNLNINRKKLVRFGVVLALFLGLTGGAFLAIYGTKFLRLEEKQKLTSEKLEVADVNNSFVTRFFIWSTGYNAFIANPVFGMGMYSYAYTSSFYNQLPKNIYKKYVSGLTLHQGYYSMLVETGIFGFTGFIIFLVMIFRRSKKIYKKAIGTPHFQSAFIAFWCLIYVITSLMFTDAWFWGRGIVMFGTILGVLTAINSQLKDQNLVVAESEPDLPNLPDEPNFQNDLDVPDETDSGK